MVTKKLNLQAVFKLNKVTEPADLSSNSKNLPAGSTGQNTSLPVASLKDSKAASKYTSSTSYEIVQPAGSASGNEKKLFVQSPSPVLDNDNYGEILNDIKIEEEVSTMLGDENIAIDNEFCYRDVNELRRESRLEAHNIINEEEHNEIKGIIHEHRQKTDSEHEHEKTNVKFSEDKNVTVDITPRNLGRKVTELIPNKKRNTPNDNFIDLIEVKNRIEPILQTGKVAISPRDVLPPKRPPSGKLRTTSSSNSQKGVINDKKLSNLLNQRPGGVNANMRTVTSTVCSKLQSGRPRSAPLNRAVSPVTTVTVDYGEEEKSDPQKDEKSKVENKPKKKRVKNKDDVETMMEKLGLSDCGLIGEFTRENKDAGKENDESVKSDDNFAKFDINTGILTATVCKSEPQKNYYEVARHSATPNKEKEEIKVEETSQVYKTTKTIEFGESEPKEMSVKTAIDPLLISTKENERFRSSAPVRGRPSSRATSNNVSEIFYLQ